jgi:hypothetical protein
MLARMRNSRGRPINAPLSCRPTVTAQPPSGPGWAHELKHDGYRFTDPCPRWSSEALHDQRRRLVKALPADCRESGSRGSKLSVGAKWNEQTFICVQMFMILAVILAAGVITLIVISLIPTIGFGAKSILFTMIVIVLGLILIVKTVR